jgi:2-keto-3-deoxy-galactonokinase
MVTWTAHNPDSLPLDMTSLNPVLGELTHTIQGESIILAQQFQQDVVKDAQNAFQGFVESGQVWALLIGLVVGYLFKSLTTFV